MTLDKNRTYTPKEALDADPNWTIPVKLGRGRMPKGGDEHCRMLARAGYRINGYQVRDVPVVNTITTAPVSAKVVDRVKTTTEKVIAEIYYTFPEEEWKALDVNGKVLPGKWGGMREVCNTCHVSLVGHMCENPTILDNRPVTLVRR